MMLLNNTSKMDSRSVPLVDVIVRLAITATSLFRGTNNYVMRFKIRFRQFTKDLVLIRQSLKKLPDSTN
jgi:hypothetical protein